MNRMKSDTVDLIAKFVCFDCRKSFERHWIPRENYSTCPECNSQTIRYDHKFRPPKKSDERQWKKIEFLRDHGFYFQRVYDMKGSSIYIDAKYPKDLNEAKEFVVKYKKQAIELK